MIKSLRMVTIAIMAWTAGCASNPDPTGETFTSPSQGSVVSDSRGAANIAALTLLSDSSYIAANTSLAVRATVFDANGRGIAGQRITFSTTSPTAVMVPASGETNAAGVFAGSLRSSSTGPVTVSAQANGITRMLTLTGVRSCPGISFQASKNVSIASTSSLFMGIGDFDGDGRPDVAADVDATHVTVFHNDAGTLSAVQTLTTDPNGQIDGIADHQQDMNGDGSIDLTVSETGAAARVYFNDGKGNFAAVDQISPAADGAATIGDMDGDGRPDLVATTYYTNSYGVMYNGGAGAFNTTPLSPLTAGGFGGAVVLSDFDGDGRLDIVAGNSNGGSIDLISNHGAKSFATPLLIPGGLAGAVDTGLAAGDLNGDGLPDIVLSPSSSPSLELRVFLTNAQDGFGAPATYAMPGWGISVAVADFNGDGRPDVVVGTSVGVVILENMGNGVLGTPLTLTDISYPLYLAVGDFDGDGTADIAAAGVGAVGVFLNACK